METQLQFVCAGRLPKNSVGGLSAKKNHANWLMSKGVSRSDRRTRTQFLAISKFFGVLHEPTNPFAIHAQKLADLLEHGRGRYDYLMSLLDSLHAKVFPNGNVAGTVHKGARAMPDKE